MKSALAVLTVGLAFLVVFSLSAQDKNSGSASAPASSSASASGSDASKGSASASSSSSGSSSASSSASGSGSPKASGSSSAHGSGSSKGSSSAEKFTKVPGDALLCKVQTWEKDSHSLELEMMTIDINVYKDVLNLEKQIADTLSNEKNPFTRQQRVTDLTNQIAEKTQKLYKPSGVKFDVKTQEDFALRCKELPTKFDEKGNLVIPTEKEKKEKRDKSHPSLYIADPEDLHANIVIQVHLVKKEGSNAKVPDILRLGPRPGSDPPAQAIKMDGSLLASMIVIVGNLDQPKP